MKDILITSSVLIAALLFLRRLFQNTVSRRFQYALWLLVLVRLLIPFNLPALEHNVLTTVEPVNHSIDTQLENQMLYAIPTETYPSSLEPGEAPVYDRTYHSEHNAAGEEVKGYYSGGVVMDQEATTHYLFMMPAKELLTVIWATGMAVMTGWFLLSNLIFYRNIRKGRTPYIDCDSKYRVYIVHSGLPSPCIFGLLRPSIYLTPAAITSPERLRHVLAHEETHARHLDPLWSLLRSICLVIYWFNPLVWAAAIVSKTDCELACDEGAMKRLGENERFAYGQTLLSLIPLRHGAVNPLLSATTMTSDKKRLRDRITRIAENRQTVAVALFLAIALVLTVCVATFTAGKVSEIPKDDTQNPPHEDLPQLSEDPPSEEISATSLDEALRQAVEARFQAEIPADYAHTDYTLLAYKPSGTAYIITLYRGFSGSPALSETGQTLIHSLAFLPAVVTFQQENDGRYTLVEYWEPSQENYEADIRAKFPIENLIDEVLLHMADYAKMLFPEDAQPFYAEDFASAPIWPAYRFTEDVTDEVICRLAAYYDPRDIYAQPVRSELLNRFLAQPVALVNALAAGCEQEMQDLVWNILVDSMAEDGIDPATRVLLSSAVLTPEGDALLQRFLPLNEPKVPETPDVPDTPVAEDPVFPGTEVWPAEPLYYTATGSESSSRTYVQNYLAGWELQEEINAGSRSFLIYRKGNSNFIFSVTRSGKYCQIPLPFADSAHQYAAVSRYHLDTAANTFTYEAVIPNRVVSINTGVLMSEAGTWRYVVNMNTDMLTRSFIPAPTADTDPNAAYEYHNVPLSLSNSSRTYHQLIDWITGPKPDPGSLSGIPFLPTGEYWEDGNGNVVCIGTEWGAPHLVREMYIRFADGTEALLTQLLSGGSVPPKNQYFQNNFFIYEYDLTEINGYRELPASGTFRFTVDLKAKTLSAEVV